MARDRELPMNIGGSATHEFQFFGFYSLFKKTDQLQIRVLVSDGQSTVQGFFVRLNR